MIKKSKLCERVEERRVWMQGVYGISSCVVCMQNEMFFVYDSLGLRNYHQKWITKHMRGSPTLSLYSISYVVVITVIMVVMVVMVISRKSASHVRRFCIQRNSIRIRKPHALIVWASLLNRICTIVYYVDTKATSCKAPSLDRIPPPAPSLRPISPIRPPWAWNLG